MQWFHLLVHHLYHYDHYLLFDLWGQLHLLFQATHQFHQFLMFPIKAVTSSQMLHVIKTDCSSWNTRRARGSCVTSSSLGWGNMTHIVPWSVLTVMPVTPSSPGKPWAPLLPYCSFLYTLTMATSHTHRISWIPLQTTLSFRALFYRNYYYGDKNIFLLEVLLYLFHPGGQCDQVQHQCRDYLELLADQALPTISCYHWVCHKISDYL